jgi:hypothetical protein
MTVANSSLSQQYIMEINLARLLNELLRSLAIN